MKGCNSIKAGDACSLACRRRPRAASSCRRCAGSCLPHDDALCCGSGGAGSLAARSWLRASSTMCSLLLEEAWASSSTGSRVCSDRLRVCGICARGRKVADFQHTWRLAGRGRLPRGSLAAGAATLWSRWVRTLLTAGWMSFCWQQHEQVHHGRGGLPRCRLPTLASCCRPDEAYSN